MSCTSGSKRRSPTPPSPPPQRMKRQRKLETEEDAETEATNDSIKQRYTRIHGKGVYHVSADDPETSEEAKKRLLSLQEPPRIDEHLLSLLNFLLLNDDDDHEPIPSMHNLPQLIAGIFETERWRELLDNVLEAIQTNSATRQEMALRVLLSLPETREESHEAYKFWRTNYDILLLRFLELFDSLDHNIQALTYDASVKLIPLFHLWRFDEDIELLLPEMIIWVQRAAENKEIQIDIVETRIVDLVGLAESCTSHFMKRIDFVFTCMFQIVEAADDKTSTFIMCQAIQMIRTLDEVNMDEASRMYTTLSDYSKSRVMENGLRLLVGIEDIPTWYNTDRGSNEFIGVSGDTLMGKFLIVRICLHSQEDFLISFGFDVIPRYLKSQDWHIRQAAVFALGAIGLTCSHDVIREQAETVLDISLRDPHPRVHWSAFEAIMCLTGDSTAKEDVGYLNKFLPRIVTIFTSTSIYPRLQFQAALVVQRLINNCDEEVVKSFSEDLVPELLKFLKLNEKFQDVAMEILISLSLLFPFNLRRYYREIVDSLKPFMCHMMFGAKSFECLNYVFNAFLGDHAIPLLTDAVEVFMLVLRIVHNWTSTHEILKIHILKALSQLCELQVVAAEHLDTIMPVLILILEKANESTTTSNIIKHTPVSDGLRHLAIEVLSTSSAQFKEQFAPWASRVSHLLTRILKSTTCPDHIKTASVKALPKVLISCQHREESEKVFNFTVKALVEASLEGMERDRGIVMIKSLNACIAMSVSVYSEDVMKKIGELLYVLLSQESLFAKMEEGESASDEMDQLEQEEEKGESAPDEMDQLEQEEEEGESEEEEGESAPDEMDQLEQEEEIIHVEKCLLIMIYTFKSAFLPQVDHLLPVVESLWGDDKNYPERVKESAISIFNLLLKDYPEKLQRYGETYAQVVMHFCYSEDPQLQQEATRGIGLCATNTELISNFDAPKAIDSLYHVIERDIQSERKMTYDVAVSALGKICEFRRHTLDYPKVIPIWLNFLPLRNDLEEAKYAHQQLCQMLERDDQDLLGPNNKNLGKITLILNEILLQGDNLATEETRSSINSLLSRFGGMK